MNIISTLLLWLAISTSVSDTHEFYLSVTEITYVKEKQSLQIISRVFIDDFEDVLNKRYSKDFKLIPNLEVEELEVYIEKYIRDKFSLETKTTVLDYNYLGKTYEDDMIYLFLEVENISTFKTLTIENLILTDLFEEQKNMIHYTSGTFKKSFILEKVNSQQTLIHH